MSKQGMTLVEVVISALILSITVGGILLVFSTEKTVVSRTGRRMQAMDFARQTLEELKNEVRPSWNVVGEPLRIQGWGAWVPLGGDFGTTFSGERRYRVEQVTGVDPDTGYRRVTVAVRWTEPSE